MSDSDRGAALWRSLLVVALGSVALVQIVAALHYLFKSGQESMALSSFAGAITFAGAAAVCRAPSVLTILTRSAFGSVSTILIIAWFAWLLIAAATVATFHAGGWDECCYLLSGLALRGYGTPYMADRPPVTHFIASVFADVPQFQNAALLLVLGASLSFWGIKRWGSTWAALPLLLLAAQDAFLSPLFEIMAELPAAALLILGFFLLARDRCFPAGVVFALCSLARWNLAVIPLALAALILVRLGWRPFARYAAGGALVTAVFLAGSFAWVEDPIAQIIHGNLLPAFDWAEEGGARPDLLSRSHFYFSNAFFLTPFGALAVIQYLTVRRLRTATSTEDWVIRTAIPVGIVSYGLVMINVGALFVRFMMPIIPLAFLVLTEFLWHGSRLLELNQSTRRLFVTVVAAVTIAWGIWPAAVLLHIKNETRRRPIFTDEFRQQVSGSTTNTDVIYAPAILPVAEVSAFHAMVALRRTLKIPLARRDSTGGIIPEADVEAASKQLVETLPNGTVVLLPTVREISHPEMFWRLTRSGR